MMKTRSEQGESGGGERALVAIAGAAPRRGQVREAPSPIHWPGLLAGLVLLPLLASTVAAFWRSLCYVAVEHAFWKSPEFWFFHTGAVLWLVCLGGLRLRLFHTAYVFGHEWTHALAAVCCGGRLLGFPVISSSGGHVVTDRTNLFITLAPYVVPFYSVAALALFGFVELFRPLPEGGLWALYTVQGFTWAFHVSFTLRMIRLRQPDFENGGRFFSVTIIALANLWLLCLLLVAASPNISMEAFFRLWLDQTGDAVRGILSLFGVA